MSSIPPAAVAVIAAAFDDYRQHTPAHRQTPRGAAEYAAAYLTADGWGLYVPTIRTRVPCPHCGIRHLVTARGLIRQHGPHANPCPGSGAPARTPARAAA